MLVARALGPEQYGTLMFLLGTFVAARQLLDMGSSTAFFTFLSQRQRSRYFVGSYFSWIGIQFFLTFLVVGLLFPSAWFDLIWKGAERSVVILAFLAAYMQSGLWSIILQMGESQRLTRWVQGVAAAVAFAHLCLMVSAWWGNWLSVRTILMVTIVEWFFAVGLTVKRFHFPLTKQENDQSKIIFTEFWSYCRPLIPYTFLSFAYEFADRWLLQTYSGSVQQAYFFVALQFGSISAIATSSILNIFWKEIAEAHHLNNLERVEILYKQVSRGMFFIAAAGAGFLAPWADDILQVTVGQAYAGGASALMIMLFFPMHQSIGQICGAMAYATNNVKVYVRIGMIVMALSVVVTYFVLANETSLVPGLGLGSVGLAGKMLVLQVISVNALAFYLSRSLGIKFDWLFQPLVALACASLGFLTYHIPQAIFYKSNQLCWALTMSAILYAAMILMLVRMKPGLAGLRHTDLATFAARLGLARN